MLCCIIMFSFSLVNCYNMHSFPFQYHNAAFYSCLLELIKSASFPIFSNHTYKLKDFGDGIYTKVWQTISFIPSATITNQTCILSLLTLHCCLSLGFAYSLRPEMENKIYYLKIKINYLSLFFQYVSNSKPP